MVVEEVVVGVVAVEGVVVEVVVEEAEVVVVVVEVLVVVAEVRVVVAEVRVVVAEVVMHHDNQYIQSFQNYHNLVAQDHRNDHKYLRRHNYYNLPNMGHFSTHHH